MKAQADFDWRIGEYNNASVVLIIDKDLGNKSVTNDAEAVLTEILEELPNLASFWIFYRDSQGIWDRMRPITREGRITNVYFAPIGGERTPYLESFERAWEAGTKPQRKDPQP